MIRMELIDARRVDSSGLDLIEQTPETLGEPWPTRELSVPRIPVVQCIVSKHQLGCATLGHPPLGIRGARSGIRMWDGRGTISRDHHSHRVRLADMLHDRTAAPDDFIVRMGRKNKDRPRWEFSLSLIGYEVRLQREGHGY
jgi:hypothetical protein